MNIEELLKDQLTNCLRKKWKPYSTIKGKWRLIGRKKKNDAYEAERDSDMGELIAFSS